MAGSENHERSSYEFILNFWAQLRGGWLRIDRLWARIPLTVRGSCVALLRVWRLECDVVRCRPLPCVRGIDTIVAESLLQGPATAGIELVIFRSGASRGSRIPPWRLGSLYLRLNRKAALATK